MALNTWWDGESEQRYWMEVATTGHMGELLIAPKFEGASWSYELVSQVRPGDRVLHWQADGPSGRGLVGWSVAKTAPEVTQDYRWKPRGMSGRKHGTDRVTDAWTVDLGGFNPFARPLTSDLLRWKIAEVVAARDVLEDEFGKPVYFPFYVYGQTQVRAQQGYLMKFPAELFGVFPQLSAALLQDPAEPGDHQTHEDDAASIDIVTTVVVEDDDVAEESVTTSNRAPHGRTTRAQDPILRSAIENWAVDAAIEHYEGLGATDILKLGKPYDVRLLLGGIERHIEVKGSSLLIDTVELTINEVTHAEQYDATDLVVVDDIDWVRYEDGTVEAEGGRLRVWRDWIPAAADLAPRRFAYSLPKGGHA